MKSQKNNLIAFLLNLAFALFEFWGGIVCGSVAISSDAVHDLGDAVSIGISYFLERKSSLPRDAKYTYGYGKYSLLGGLITTVVLLAGSVVMMIKAAGRLLSPCVINYSGMTAFAVVGLIVNITAALFTRDGKSINCRAVNLHMLEDVFGWAVVLVGSVVMRFTGLSFIDPIISLAVSAFIIFNALKYLRDIGDVFLERTPRNLDLAELIHHLSETDGVLDVHHVHVRSTDGYHVSATMHVVTDGDTKAVKDAVRHQLNRYGIHHATLELEYPGEVCGEHDCPQAGEAKIHNHHHHHH